MLIGVLGNILKHYNFLKQIVDILKRLIRSRKLLICIIPATLGLLAVPGGAYLSAPFVDELGKEIKMEPSKRVAANLAFRHVLVTIYPFSAMLLYLSAVIAGAVSLYSVIGLNMGYALTMLLASYFLYLPRGRDNLPVAHKKERNEAKKKDLKALAFYTMPIYFVVLVTMIPGVSAAVALVLGILLTCCLISVVNKNLNRKRDNLLKVLRKGININMMITVAGLFFIQNTIMNLDQINDIFLQIFSHSSIIITLLAIAAGCFILSIFTGLAFIPLSIFIPIATSLPLSHMEILLYVFFIWTWSYMGYYFAMGHLCQVLSLQYIKDAKLTDVYKQHLKLFPFLAISSFVLFFIYHLLLVR